MRRIFASMILVAGAATLVRAQDLESIPSDKVRLFAEKLADEAGRIDGCSEFGIYFKLVMPLVRPMAAAFCLVSFLGNWNAFFSPNVFLQSQDKLTLPVVLNLYITQYENEYGVFLAGTALAMLPPAILFFALQREFISGLTSGAVKG